MARKRKNPVMHVEGADELNKALRSVGDRVAGLVLLSAAEKGAKVIEEEAAERAPEDEGNLKDAMMTQVTRRQVGRAVVDVGPDKHKARWYSSLQEFGTQHMPAQPYLRPAFDAKAEAAKDTVAKALRDALKDLLS